MQTVWWSFDIITQSGWVQNRLRHFFFLHPVQAFLALLSPLEAHVGLLNLMPAGWAGNSTATAAAGDPSMIESLMATLASSSAASTGLLILHSFSIVELSFLIPSISVSASSIDCAVMNWGLFIHEHRPWLMAQSSDFLELSSNSRRWPISLSISESNRCPFLASRVNSGMFPSTSIATADF